MSQDLRERAHDVDATLRVGKAGLDPVVDELESQLAERELVKVKFLRSARGGTTTAALADELGERAGAEVIDTRGHTVVFH